MRKTHIKYISVLGFLALFMIPIISTSVTLTAPITTKNQTSSESIIVDNLPTDEPESSISYSPDGKGYLKSIGPGKNLLHVEGSAYQMGYQHGYLLAEGVSEIASYDLFKAIVLGFVGLDEQEARELLGDLLTEGIIKDLLGWLIDESIIDVLFNTLDDILDIVIEIVKIIISLNLCYVPSEFMLEMRGIRDGATAAGYPVELEQILILNMGFDALLGVLYPVLTPLIALLELLGFHMCDGFVAMGDATTDGRTIMGRDLMFNPIVFKDYGLLIEYVPNSGYKFIAVSAPAFVGVTSAMNVKGIGIGCDMVPATDCTPGSFGMGLFLTCRKMVQYASEWTSARNIVKYSKRGTSWLYFIADGRGSRRGAVILETSAHYCYERRIDYIKPWYIPNPWYKQIEKKDDLLVVANHMIRPEANLLCGSYGISDSRWRYETLTNLVLNAYGNIDIAVAKALIDYLHPPNYGYYGSDPDQAIGGTISCFDLTNLEIWSLYGYYDDPWVHYAL